MNAHCLNTRERDLPQDGIMESVRSASTQYANVGDENSEKGSLQRAVREPGRLGESVSTLREMAQGGNGTTIFITSREEGEN